MARIIYDITIFAELECKAKMAPDAEQLKRDLEETIQVWSQCYGEEEYPCSLAIDVEVS